MAILIAGRLLTIHTPAGFDQFALAAGTSVGATRAPRIDELPPDPAALIGRYGVLP